jgi:hypothetical protein
MKHRSDSCRPVAVTKTSGGLRDLLHQAVKLLGDGLIGAGVSGEFWRLDAHLHMKVEQGIQLGAAADVQREPAQPIAPLRAVGIAAQSF